jgi:hypothetical protein
MTSGERSEKGEELNDRVQITFAIGSSKITEIRHVVMTFSRYQK